MRIAICDDDYNFLIQTQTQIKQSKKIPANTFIELFKDGDSLIHAHTTLPFDIIFLDVVMPLLNGIETARELRYIDKKVKIVFLSSSSEFAVASYTVKANNYLLKPIDSDKLSSCLDELIAEIRQNERYIVIHSTDGYCRIELKNIEYVESQNKHVLFMRSDGRSILSTEPLYSFTETLTRYDGFVKCHRSYIVNIHHIAAYTQKEIKMCSGYRIPISRNCHKDFEAAYFSIIFGEAGEEL